MKDTAPQVQHLGVRPYLDVWQQMQRFTEQRDSNTPDQLWLVEHPPIFTLGRAADRRHLLAPGEIPVVASDRGGEVTYHAPGQLLLYTLIDLRRRGIGVRRWVETLEQAIIRLLRRYRIEASARRDAPGVYVAGRKIASLGLRVKRGCAYHGIAFNIDLDLAPFARINPCGYAELEVTRLHDLGVTPTTEEVAEGLIEELQELLQMLGREA